MILHSNIAVHPLTGAIGAEVEGVDLKRLDDEGFARIHKAFLDHQLLVFRDQCLSIEQQRAFSLRFGPLMVLPYVRPMDAHADVIAVLKQAEERDVGVFGGDWHSDFSFLPEPPMASVLCAREVPPVGGDTVWTNMCAACDALPDALRRRLTGMTGIHTGAPYGAANAPPADQRASGSVHMTRGDPAADKETPHPVVCRHPETGRSVLFVNPIYTRRLAGMDAKQSAALLEQLYAHCTRPEFTCRHRWRAGDVVVWDNRCTLHYAVNDYDGHRRLLYRTAIAGRRPAAAGNQAAAGPSSPGKYG